MYLGVRGKREEGGRLTALGLAGAWLLFGALF